MIMTREQKQRLIDVIEKNGVNGASKLLGISIADLILKSGIDFNHEVAYQILNELGRDGKLPRSYGIFDIDYNGWEGIVAWTKNSNTDYFGGSTKLNEILNVFATPFWDGENYIPVESSWYTLFDGKEKIFDEELTGEYFIELKSRTHFDGLEDLLTWYKHFYLPKVNETIIEDILPQIRQKFKNRTF